MILGLRRAHERGQHSGTPPPQSRTKQTIVKCSLISSKKQYVPINQNPASLIAALVSERPEASNQTLSAYSANPGDSPSLKKTADLRYP